VLVHVADCPELVVVVCKCCFHRLKFTWLCSSKHCYHKLLSDTQRYLIFTMTLLLLLHQIECGCLFIQICLDIAAVHPGVEGVQVEEIYDLQKPIEGYVVI
jgi:hypothetical protein